MAKSQPKPARRTPGRPKRNATGEQERVIISVSVEPDLVRRLDVAAQREARTRSAQVALLIRRWLEEQGR
jgi:hypothetical protein